jgi:hypothetical protein
LRPRLRRPLIWRHRLRLLSSIARQTSPARHKFPPPAVEAPPVSTLVSRQ